MKVISLGTISQGTLDDIELGEAFAQELATIREDELLSSVVNPDWYGRVDDALGSWEEDGWAKVSDLFDLLEEVPALLGLDYTHFGTHEADGTNFGWWPSMDSLLDDIRSGEVAEESGEGLWVDVNDHGNLTLHMGEEELWSVV